MTKKKILYPLFLFLAANAYPLTLAQIQTEIRRNVQDTSSIAEDQRYSSTTIINLINEAQRDISNQSWLSYKTTEYALTPRTTFYNLPTDLINILQVDLRQPRQNYVQLDEVARESLYDTNPGWESVSGTPVEYFVRQTSFSNPSGTFLNQIAYLPILPTGSTGTVRIWYTNQVDDLTMDSDVPFNGKAVFYPYHMAIVHYVTMRLKGMQNRLDEARFYAELYIASVKTLQDKAFQKPNYKPSTRTSR